MAARRSQSCCRALAGVVQVVEDMRASVRSLVIRHETSPRGVVTLSAGVASWHPGQVTTWASLVEAADTALYAAKALGRNTFTVHPRLEAAVPVHPVAHEHAA